MSVFASEFWRSLYFLGMGGQASEANPNAMFGLFTGSATFTGTLAADAISTQPARRGGKGEEIRRWLKPRKTYVEWSETALKEIAKREDALLAELLGTEPEPLPIAEKKGLDPAAELERINTLLLKAMAAAADDARRKEAEALRKAAKKNKVAVPDTEQETKALVYWLVKRAEALRELEEDDEDVLLLLAA
jgi:hypothetical protein